ncbi:AraC family transcriptional regulator [Ancylobacter radicis]|uniref:Helix-turn-helix transcriptional regulator n=1 Tax=Ancylobacter radicis TaxID=2836179 RepID=A0ABS5R5T0_9HYPH|nr:AraC family transcriptional regulator [Ancylobacter radicis]MBS9477009.1 helix-turn-helix transcriptional regulator [Ancylobacter radicis]
MSLHIAPLPNSALPIAALGTRPEERDGHERLSVELGHMGVVVAIAAPAAEPDTAATLRLDVPPAAFDRYLDLFAGEDAAGLSSAADPVVRRLSRALDAAERGQTRTAREFGGLYADALRLAIVARLAGARPVPAHDDSEDAEDALACDSRAALDAPAREPRRPKSGLPKWRFKRVAAYVEDHLGETITLADMANAAGLSRMHFAAQFRVLTGLRPHEYLLRQRIERAQKMLVETRDPLVEIALAVGFQTQAHFTTVFRRFAGDTPYQWRCANRTRN